MSDLSFFDAAGLLGAAVYLGSYAALQLGLMRGQGYLYAALNATAAGLVLVSLQAAFNLSSAIIQVAWIVISLVGITRQYLLSRRSRLNAEEQDFVDTAFPLMDKLHARRLLDLGEWRSDRSGVVLTELGKPVSHLIYMASGEADVEAGGSVVACLGERSFIGDMTALTGEPATGTVTLTREARMFALPVASLRKLVERDGEVRRHVQAALTGQIAGKLVNANRALAEARGMSDEYLME